MCDSAGCAMIYMQKPPGAGGAEKVKKMKIIKLAAAKLNLLLDLTGIFPNGYHGIYTVMQSVDLTDVVSIEQAQDIALTCDAPGIPCDIRNTAHKAARLFFAQTGIEGGAHIDIQKRIPSQAGMAGGSADAAAVLCGLNELYQGGCAVLHYRRYGALPEYRRALHQIAGFARLQHCLRQARL